MVQQDRFDRFSEAAKRLTAGRVSPAGSQAEDSRRGAVRSEWLALYKGCNDVLDLPLGPEPIKPTLLDH